MIFFSPQGLGNSITNFPILNVLRKTRPVKVVCFNNGSSAFFRTFHQGEVQSVDSSFELLRSLLRLKDDSAYVTYPTWKKETAAAILCSAAKKFVMKTPTSRVPSWILHSHTVGDSERHHIENNIALLRTVEPDAKVDLNIREALGLPKQVPPAGKRVLGIHPTASNVFKYYPFNFWLDLIADIGPGFERIHVFCGRGSTESQFCKDLVSQFPLPLRDRVELHPGADFRTLVKIMDTLTQFIGSDSALMHLAALMDKRVLALWSFANYKIIYPYGDDACVYIPNETLQATMHEYPDRIPPYMSRASAESVASIVRGEAESSFAIQPLYKRPVHFFEY